MNNSIRRIISLVVIIMPLMAVAAPPRHGVQNRPYADMRQLHLGFSVGTHLPDMTFANSGATAYDGTVWYAEQPSYSPGFCVGAVGDLRLNNWFNLRFNPGLWRQKRYDWP